MDMKGQKANLAIFTDLFRNLAMRVVTVAMEHTGAA